MLLPVAAVVAAAVERFAQKSRLVICRRGAALLAMSLSLHIAIACEQVRVSLIMRLPMRLVWRLRAPTFFVR